MCFLCFNRGHAARQCAKKGRAMCTVCKGPPYNSICNADRPKDTPVLPTNAMSDRKIDDSTPKFTYLQNARVRIVGPTGLSKLARCVLDSGSQTSFVSTSIIDVLKLDMIDQQNLASGHQHDDTRSQATVRGPQGARGPSHRNPCLR
jgi:hypothetical protein